MSTSDAADWSGPGSRGSRQKFSWNHFLWSLVWPARGHRILPTVSGTVLLISSVPVLLQRA